MKKIIISAVIGGAIGGFITLIGILVYTFIQVQLDVHKEKIKKEKK